MRRVRRATLRLVAREDTALLGTLYDDVPGPTRIAGECTDAVLPKRSDQGVPVERHPVHSWVWYAGPSTSSYGVRSTAVPCQLPIP
jgi:hypothetical protein